MFHTPFFPELRARLAALGWRTAQSLRQLDFLPLAEKLRVLLPPQLLASEDEGLNSRDNVYSLRLTFEGFVWQMLKPKTSCREVVRAIQALFQSRGLGSIDEGNSGYVQARQRLPMERLEKALARHGPDRRSARPGLRSRSSQRTPGHSGGLFHHPAARHLGESKTLSPDLRAEARLRFSAHEVSGPL